jgi:hypothetical protein
VTIPDIAYHVGTEKVTWIQSSGGNLGSPHHREARVVPDRHFPALALDRNGFALCTAQRWPGYVFLDVDWTATSSLFKCEDCKAEFDRLARDRA